MKPCERHLYDGPLPDSDDATTPYVGVVVFAALPCVLTVAEYVDLTVYARIEILISTRQIRVLLGVVLICASVKRCSCLFKSPQLIDCFVRRNAAHLGDT